MVWRRESKHGGAAGPSRIRLGMPRHSTWRVFPYRDHRGGAQLPSGAAELVVRVPSCDFAAIGAALDAGARAVIVPQIESAADAQRVPSPRPSIRRSGNEVGASSAASGVVRR